MKLFVAGRKLVEVIARQGGQFRRVGDVENGLPPGHVGGVPQGGGLSRPRESLDEPDPLPGIREFRLGLGPGRWNVVLLPEFLHPDRQVMLRDGLRIQRRVVVMMANVAEEDSALWRRFEFRVALERRRAPGGPPGVEMAAMVAAQGGSTPSAVFALGGLVVLAPEVHQEPLRSEERRVGKECRSRCSPFY